jgi:hypothetical protein
MTMTNWQRVEPLIDVTDSEAELAPGAGCGASERPGPVTDRHTNAPFST